MNGNDSCCYKDAIVVSTDISKIGGISPELLRRYVEMRQKLDLEANTIQSISSMLALLETCGDDSLNVDPVALGKVSQGINRNILNIREILDDFIYIVQAKLELEQQESKL